MPQKLSVLLSRGGYPSLSEALTRLQAGDKVRVTPKVVASLLGSCADLDLSVLSLDVIALLIPLDTQGYFAEQIPPLLTSIPLGVPHVPSSIIRLVQAEQRLIPRTADILLRILLCEECAPATIPRIYAAHFLCQTPEIAQSRIHDLLNIMTDCGVYQLQTAVLELILALSRTHPQDVAAGIAAVFGSEAASSVLSNSGSEGPLLDAFLRAHTMKYTNSLDTGVRSLQLTGALDGDKSIAASFADFSRNEFALDCEYPSIMYYWITGCRVSSSGGGVLFDFIIPGDATTAPEKKSLLLLFSNYSADAGFFKKEIYPIIRQGRTPVVREAVAELNFCAGMHSQTSTDVPITAGERAAFVAAASQQMDNMDQSSPRESHNEVSDHCLTATAPQYSPMMLQTPCLGGAACQRTRTDNHETHMVEARSDSSIEASVLRAGSARSPNDLAELFSAANPTLTIPSSRLVMHQASPLPEVTKPLFVPDMSECDDENSLKTAVSRFSSSIVQYSERRRRILEDTAAKSVEQRVSELRDSHEQEWSKASAMIARRRSELAAAIQERETQARRLRENFAQQLSEEDSHINALHAEYQALQKAAQSFVEKLSRKHKRETDRLESDLERLLSEHREAVRHVPQVSERSMLQGILGLLGIQK